MTADVMREAAVVAHPLRTGITLADIRLAAAPWITEAQRATLCSIPLTRRSVAAHTELLREGEVSDGLSILLDGWACRYKTTRDGRRQIPALLVPGDIADLDMMAFRRPDYGVRMLTAGTILSLPRDRVMALLADMPGLVRSFAWFASVENAILSQWALCLSRHSARERLAHLLCELAIRVGASADTGSVRFELPLTQEHLADVLGLTPVHINRTLQQLRTDGLVVTAGRTITIPDIVPLRRIAGFDAAYLHAADPEWATPAA